MPWRESGSKDLVFVGAGDQESKTHGFKDLGFDDSELHGPRKDTMYIRTSIESS